MVEAIQLNVPVTCKDETHKLFSYYRFPFLSRQDNSLCAHVYMNMCS